MVQHPLRSDPFRDFASFATSSLGHDTELRLSLPLHEIEHRFNNLTSLDKKYEHLHACSSDLKNLLLQLHKQGPCSLERLLNSWPPAQHDVLRLSCTWLAKLGFIQWFHPSTTR